MIYCEQIWKPVVGYEGLYEISNMGNLKGLIISKRFREPRILTPTKNKFGYMRCPRLCGKNDRPKQPFIHVLVARAFLGPIPPSKEINHIDGNKAHNWVENLEYVTRKENMVHAVKNGLRDGIRRGNSHPHAKLSDDIVREIRGCDLSDRVLARKFNVSTVTIRNARIGALWSHVST